MTQAVFPFFESAEAATKHAIQASGKKPKEVAAALWPDKDVVRAQTDLLNALNENRAEHLTADQHLFIANHCGQFDWLYYVCDKSSHSRPYPIAPEDEQAALQREFVESVNRLEKIQARLTENGKKLRAGA